LIAGRWSSNFGISSFIIGTRCLAITSTKTSESSVGLFSESKHVEFRRLDTSEQLESSHEKLRRIYGCLGLFGMGHDVFLVVITKSERVGRIRRASICRVLEVKFYSLLHHDYDWLNSLQVPLTSANSESLGSRGEHPCIVVERYLSSGNFYFSYEYDMTLSAQEFHQLNSTEGSRPGTVRQSLWSTYDSRFFWNRYLLRDLTRIKENLDPNFREDLDRTHILVLIMQGFVEIYERDMGNGRTLQCGVLSRLSCERAGTRFLTRGIDDEGNVANFVETEQLLVLDDILFSFVQVRGSVPTFWEQRGVQLGLTVDLVRDIEASKYAFRRHFEFLVARYGTVRIVNLLSSRNAEASLSDTYEKLWRLTNDPKIDYIPFDFNYHCRGSNYQNIAMLLHSLMDDIHSFGYFVYDYVQKSSVMQQKGIFRVNCLDCLDR
jgi:synaptojanin